MSNLTPTIEDVRSCLSAVLPELPEDSRVNLFSTKAIDSLRLIETVVHLEKSYAVQFDSNLLSVETFETLEKIHATVVELLARKGGQ